MIKNIRPTLDLAIIALSLMTVAIFQFVWAFYLDSHPGEPTSVITYLWYVGYVGIGGITMTALLASDLVNSSGNWWRTARVIAVLAALINLAQNLDFVWRREYPPFVRDIFASAILVGVLTLAIAALGSWLGGRNWKPGVRIGICGVATIAMSGTALFLLLIIHCTSGDCI